MDCKSKLMAHQQTFSINASITIWQIVYCFCSLQSDLKNKTRLGQMKVTEDVCVWVSGDACLSLCYWGWLPPLKQDVWLLSCNLHRSNWLLSSPCEYTRTLVPTSGCKHIACLEQQSDYVLHSYKPNVLKLFFLPCLNFALFDVFPLPLFSFSNVVRLLYSSLHRGGLLQTYSVSRQHRPVLVRGQIW